MAKNKTNWLFDTKQRVYKVGDFDKSVPTAFLSEAQCSSGTEEGVGSFCQSLVSPLSEMWMLLAIQWETQVPL